MIRDEAISVIVDSATRHGVVIFAGNGFNARALYAAANRPDFFYMLGSMGLCASLGAGFAHCTGLPVIAVEGDANALMGLSGFPVVAAAVTTTFVHVVLDNSVSESTGGHRTLSPRVDFLQIASGAGFDRVSGVGNTFELQTELEAALECPSRTFIRALTEASPTDTLPRVPLEAYEIMSRFREAIKLRLSLNRSVQSHEPKQ